MPDRTQRHVARLALLVLSLVGASCLSDDASDEDVEHREETSETRDPLLACRSGTQTATRTFSPAGFLGDSDVFTPEARYVIPATLPSTNPHRFVDVHLSMTAPSGATLTTCTYRCTNDTMGNCVSSALPLVGCTNGWAAGGAPAASRVTLNTALAGSVPSSHPTFSVSNTYTELEPCPAYCTGLDDSDDCTIDRCVDDGFGGLVAAHTDTCTGTAELEPGVAPTVGDSLAVLVDEGILHDVDPGSLDMIRAGGVSGRVVYPGGSPAIGVHVAVAHHDEYGWTETDANGEYVLLVEAGASLVVDIKAPGYLPVHRSVTPAWQGWARADDTTLTLLDEKETTVPLGAALTTMAVARASTSTDSAGSRAPTILVPAGTTAVMEMPGGTTTPLTNMTVRVTEYTVGASGPSRMPAALPPSSAFTYAAEFSVDEADAAGATGVAFPPTSPVVFYLENFRGFSVGVRVPVGRYDREKLAWIPEDDGRVVKIISISGSPSAANVDTNGDGVVNGSDMTLSSAERQKLASLYPVSTTLWRVPLTHFSPHDCNWPPFPDLCQGDDCMDLPPPGPDGPEPDPCEEQGSIIECENQILGERIPVAGTGMTLNYRSDRVPGYVAGRSVRAALIGPAINGLLRAELALDVAGKHITSSVDCLTETCTPSMFRTLQWDGFDRFGRFIQGKARGTVTATLEYPVFYGQGGAAAARAFGLALPPYTGTGLAAIDARGTRKKTWPVPVGGWDARSFGLGGWTLDGVHVYDPVARVLTQGDGKRRNVESVGPTARKMWSDVAARGVLGSDAVGFSANRLSVVRRPIDDPTAPDTLVATLPTGVGGPDTLDVSSEGTIHITMLENSGGLQIPRVYRLDGSSWTHVAGAYSATNDDLGDGMAATLARLYADSSEVPRIATGPDGALYISGHCKVRRVGPDGVIERVAGLANGTCVQNGPDDVPATTSELDRITAIDVGANGFLYIAAGNPGNMAPTPQQTLRFVDNKGTIHFLAGRGTNEAASSTLAAARLAPLWGLKAISDDRLIFATVRSGWADPSALATLTIAAGGYLTVAAGGSRACSVYGSCPIGSLATAVEIPDTDLVSERADGTIVAAASPKPSVPGQSFVVTPPLPGLGTAEVTIPSQDAKEVYVFDAAGRHLETRDAETNLLTLSIEYDAEGRIENVVDWRGVDDTLLPAGRVTAVTRAGDDVTVTGPDGHITLLALDADGWLESVRPPDGSSSEAYAMTYGTGSATGLLQSFRKPASTDPSTFEYDANGKLIRDTDPMDHDILLTRTETATGWKVAFQRPSGLITEHKIEEPSPGQQSRVATRPGITAATMNRTPDEQRVTVRADGTTITRELSPDPRWGMLAPYVSSEKTQVPSGPLRTIIRKRSVTGMTSPLSFGTLTEESWINPTIWGGLPTGPKTIRTFAQATPTLPAVETITSPELDVFTRTLDDFGRTDSIDPPDALTMAFGYDPAGRMLTSTQGSGGAARTTTRTYRGDGLLDTLTDAESQPSTYDWDAAGRLIDVERPDSQHVAFGYDTSGNLDFVTPPGKTAHLFDQDDLDQVTLYDPPDPVAGSWSTTYLFDADRRIDSETRPGSITVDYQYDGTKGLLNGLVKSTTDKITLGYDSAGRITARSGPTWASGTPKQALGYTYQGSLVTKEALTGDVAGEVIWTYNPRFLPDTEVIDPIVGSNQSIAFTYDGEGKLLTAGALTVTRGDGGRIDTLSSTYSSQTIVETRSYDDFGALEEILVQRNGSNVFRETITVRDNLGRIVEREEAFGAGAADVYEYEYDLAGRLRRVLKNSVEVEEYAYDANGNRTSAQYNGGTALTASAADAQDRIATFGPYTMSYKANGELAGRDSSTSEDWSLTYNAFGQSTSLISDADGAKRPQSYDARGRRVRSQTNNGSTFQGAWLWRSDLQPVAQLSSTGAIQQRYVYADSPNVPELVVAGTDRWRLVKDHLGSVRLVVDTATGTTLRRLDFDAFGRIINSTGTLGQVPFGFAGGFYRSEVPFIRFGARDYDPELGRWTQKDPTRFAGGENLYAYADNDPVNLVDRTGRHPEDGSEGGYPEGGPPDPPDPSDDDGGLCPLPDCNFFTGCKPEPDQCVPYSRAQEQKCGGELSACNDRTHDSGCCDKEFQKCMECARYDFTAEKCP